MGLSHSLDAPELVFSLLSTSERQLAIAETPRTRDLTIFVMTTTTTTTTTTQPITLSLCTCARGNNSVPYLPSHGAPGAYCLCLLMERVPTVTQIIAVVTKSRQPRTVKTIAYTVLVVACRVHCPASNNRLVSVALRSNLLAVDGVLLSPLSSIALYSL